MVPLYIAMLISASLTLGQGQLTGGTITGRILGPNGAPASGVRVAATPADSAEFEFIALAQTDEGGRYRLVNVPPGEYRIIAGAIATPTYYPGTADQASAKIVILRDGASFDGVDFSVANAVAVPFGRIRYSASNNVATIESSRSSVQVSNPRFPVVSGKVVVEGAGPLVAIPSIPIQTGTSKVLSTADGTFLTSLNYYEPEIWVTAPVDPAESFGDYYVQSIVYGATDLLKNPLKVDLTTSRAITITLAVGTQISGNVRTESGEPANISVYLIPRIPEEERPDLPRRANTDAQGNFVLRGVAPGDYDLFSEGRLDSGRESVALTVLSSPLPPLNLRLGARRSLTLASR